jgi:hypothetical protein
VGSDSTRRNLAEELRLEEERAQEIREGYERKISAMEKRIEDLEQGKFGLVRVDNVVNRPAAETGPCASFDSDAKDVLALLQGTWQASASSGTWVSSDFLHLSTGRCLMCFGFAVCTSQSARDRHPCVPACKSQPPSRVSACFCSVQESSRKGLLNPHTSVHR